jgi:hypothetical protein
MVGSDFRSTGVRRGDRSHARLCSITVYESRFASEAADSHLPSAPPLPLSFPPTPGLTLTQRPGMSRGSSQCPPVLYNSRTTTGNFTLPAGRRTPPPPLSLRPPSPPPVSERPGSFFTFSPCASHARLCPITVGQRGGGTQRGQPPPPSPLKGISGYARWLSRGSWYTVWGGREHRSHAGLCSMMIGGPHPASGIAESAAKLPPLFPTALAAPPHHPNARADLEASHMPARAL